MANEVDDTSADPDRGSLEPARSAPSDGAVPHESAMASGTQPIGSARAPAAVLRQGLPRTGAYRASAVRRSPHPTPVATPIVTATPVPATPVAAPGIEPPPADHPPDSIAPIAPPPSSIEPAAGSMISDAGREAEAADPRASDDAVLHAADGSTEPTPLASVDTASSTPAIAAVPIAPTAEAACVPTTDVAARPIGRHIRRIALGLLGAAVLGGAIVLGALGAPADGARTGSRSALPAAADLVHAVSDRPPPVVEVAPSRAAAPPRAASVAPPPPATPSPPAAPPAKPATSAAAAGVAKPAPPATTAPARTDSATREPPRARPASPPRPTPARPLTYDPDALFLPKQ
jgi:hypothetical protein